MQNINTAPFALRLAKFLQKNKYNISATITILVAINIIVSIFINETNWLLSDLWWSPLLFLFALTVFLPKLHDWRFWLITPIVICIMVPIIALVAMPIILGLQLLIIYSKRLFISSSSPFASQKTSK